MAKKHTQTPHSRSFSVRYSNPELFEVENEIEQSGLNTSEYFKSLRKENQNLRKLKLQLAELEQRLLDKSFEMVAAIAGLDDRQKASAKQSYQEQLKRRQ